MKKITVIGCPGSGKTTLSNALGSKLGIPVYHLDKIMWQENYTPIPYTNFITAQQSIFDTATWIIDGNFTKSIPLRIQHADTVIFFDISRVICAWRLTKRYIKYRGTSRPDMGGNNKDEFGYKFIKFVLTYPRKKILAMLAEAPNTTTVVIIRNDRDLNNFLKVVTG